ncbi:hypothetical protein JK359_30870 [Streptomyces actinomycinicus]|uniref:Uncharacterized protein n=1 Tax=Streptomyces actinomycinicus TaxID=1695166 RepID=A0A937EQK2_9ACTN|nr:hypothetical protein [Streptomyces actinomycinicus]
MSGRREAGPSGEQLVAMYVEFHQGIVRRAGNSVPCSPPDGLAGPATRARIWRGLTHIASVERGLRSTP